MLRCETCGAILDETELTLKRSTLYGVIEACPNCLGENIEEVKRCNYCGEWTSEGEIDQGFCPDCSGRTLRLFRDLINNTFTEEQIDFLSHSDCF